MRVEQRSGLDDDHEPTVPDGHDAFHLDANPDHSSNDPVTGANRTADAKPA